MRIIISQREAHRLRKQVATQANRITDFEWMVRRIRRGNMGEGVEVYEDKTPNSSLAWVLQTAQTLGHLVVVRQNSSIVTYKALPLPSEDVLP